jgi:hypothetical protein
LDATREEDVVLTETQRAVAARRRDHELRAGQRGGAVKGHVLQPGPVGSQWPEAGSLELARDVAGGALRPRGAELRNFIVQGFKRVGVYVDQASYGADRTWQSGELTLGSAIITGNLQGAIDGPGGSWAFDIDGGNPEIADPYNLSSPNFMPSASGIARNRTVPVVQPPNDGFFESVDFIGGVGDTDWTQGWTDFSQG